MKPITIRYTCPGCEREFRVRAYPGSPAQTYGPPEDCSPAEPAEYFPDNCPGCNLEIDEETAEGLVRDVLEDRDES